MPVKTFVYRLYPSKPQKRLLESTVETCRRFYNDCLAERKTVYESEDRDRFDSFGLKEYGNGFKLSGRRLKVSSIGRISVRWRRELPAEPSTLRIVRKADGWYACFACGVITKDLPSTGRHIGLDVGIKSLLTDSSGNSADNPKWHRAGQKKLRVLQRSVSRKKKWSSNRRKSVKALQRHHLKISGQGQDFLIHGKAEEAGRVVLRVNPSYTSKSCSGCGYIFEKQKLSDRWITCPECGLSLDRDHNAAINILMRGLASLGGGGQSPWAPSGLMSGPLTQEAVGF